MKSIFGSINDPLKEKIPYYKRKLLFQKFVIKIDLDNNLNSFYIGEDLVELNYLYDDVIYDLSIPEEKNFVAYLLFWYKVKDYIELIKDEINLKTEIKLELTIKSKKQSKETLCCESERRNYIKDFYDVNCLSSFEYKGKNFEFLDENVLIYGLNGEKPGLAFLFNELCNDDYKIEKKIYEK